MRTTRTVMRHPRAPGSLTAEDIVRHPEESGGVDKEPRGNKCAGVPQGSMAQEPDCTHRVATSPKQANICQLGRFRGLVTDGMCRRCIKDGLNVATIIEPSLLTKAKNFAAASGPGTELKKLLGLLGFRVTPTCKCNKRAKYMDEMGLDWCRANIETISGWLKEEAEARKLPYLEVAGKKLIQLAIYRARKSVPKPDPGTT